MDVLKDLVWYHGRPKNRIGISGILKQLELVSGSSSKDKVWYQGVLKRLGWYQDRPQTLRFLSAPSSND